MTSPMVKLRSGVTVFERGWLSANNIFFDGARPALIDSGYVTHAAQTVALVKAALNGRPLELLLNTHLHSDHCGGNSALQKEFPGLKTLIPPGLAAFVQPWDAQGLTFVPTGQECAPFVFDELLPPGTVQLLGGQTWQVHAAPGHDPHSVILFEPEHRVLISADALWERGFGVIFPALEGLDGFNEVAATLDLIESLAPLTVIPGHGPVFTEVSAALSYASRRLDGFKNDPKKHALHGAKVLVKFKLLDLQRVRTSALAQWAIQTPLIVSGHRHSTAEKDILIWIHQLLDALVHSGAAKYDGEWIVNA